MSLQEQPVVFDCLEEQLCGIIHLPEQPVSQHGVLIVTGGPQYRVGSHRQFVLLARFLALNGIPVMRFDFRGMGDSSGDQCDFENVNQDISAAIDSFIETADGLQDVVIWGLCDAASAALFYAHQDLRVKGIVLLNPWVRTEAGQAKAYLKHYYISRLFSTSFWRKLLSGKFRLGESTRSMAGLAKTATMVEKSEGNMSSADNVCGAAPLPDRMLEGLRRFDGSVLVVLSGDDLTADEFRDLIKSSSAWKKVLRLKKVQVKQLPRANHTFSSAECRGQVERMTLDFVAL